MSRSLSYNVQCLTGDDIFSYINGLKAFLDAFTPGNVNIDFSFKTLSLPKAQVGNKLEVGYLKIFFEL